MGAKELILELETETLLYIICVFAVHLPRLVRDLGAATVAQDRAGNWW